MDASLVKRIVSRVCSSSPDACVGVLEELGVPGEAARALAAGRPAEVPPRVAELLPGIRCGAGKKSFVILAPPAGSVHEVILALAPRAFRGGGPYPSYWGGGIKCSMGNNGFVLARSPWDALASLTYAAVLAATPDAEATVAEVRSRISPALQAAREPPSRVVVAPAPTLFVPGLYLAAYLSEVYRAAGLPATLLLGRETADAVEPLLESLRSQTPLEAAEKYRGSGVVGEAKHYTVTIVPAGGEAVVMVAPIDPATANYMKRRCQEQCRCHGKR